MPPAAARGGGALSNPLALNPNDNQVCVHWPACCLTNRDAELERLLEEYKTTIRRYGFTRVAGRFARRATARAPATLTSPRGESLRARPLTGRKPTLGAVYASHGTKTSGGPGAETVPRRGRWPDAQVPVPFDVEMSPCAVVAAGESPRAATASDGDEVWEVDARPWKRSTRPRGVVAPWILLVANQTDETVLEYEVENRVLRPARYGSISSMR